MSRNGFTYRIKWNKYEHYLFHFHWLSLQMLRANILRISGGFIAANSNDVYKNTSPSIPAKWDFSHNCLALVSDTCDAYHVPNFRIYVKIKMYSLLILTDFDFGSNIFSLIQFMLPWNWDIIYGTPCMNAIGLVQSHARMGVRLILHRTHFILYTLF